MGKRWGELGSLLVLLVACLSLRCARGQDIGTPPPDGSVPDGAPPILDRSIAPKMDKPAPKKDSAVPIKDTHVPKKDAFVPKKDTFVPAPDTFVPAPDTFVPAPDTFVPAPDTFVPKPDLPPPCSYSCSVDLTKSTSSCSGAVIKQTLAGSRGIFKVDLSAYKELTLTVNICSPQTWVLNIGNSPSNNGHGGDASQFSNDSELQIYGTTFAVYGNQNSGSASLLSVPGFVPAAGCVTRKITVADSTVLTDTPKHILNSPYAFRINQPDSEGAPDALYYVGLNRVVQASSSRVGAGVQTATFCLK